MKIEIDIICSIASSLIGKAVILVIMYVKTFETVVNVFIYNVLYVFGVTQTDNFQYQNQIVDIDNITQGDQRKNVLITDKNLFFTQMFWQQGLHQ